MITTCLFSFRVNKFVYLFHNLFFLINALHSVVSLVSLYFVYCILKFKTKHDDDDVEHAQSMHFDLCFDLNSQWIDDNTDITVAAMQTFVRHTRTVNTWVGFIGNYWGSLDHTRTRRWDPIETAIGMKLKNSHSAQQWETERANEKEGEKKHLKKRKAN